VLVRGRFRRDRWTVVRLASLVDSMEPDVRALIVRATEAWREAVGYFYDGRFFAMLRLRGQPHDNWIGRIVSPHASAHLPRVFTGESTAGVYDRNLLALMMRFGLRALEDPDWKRWPVD